MSDTDSLNLSDLYFATIHFVAFFIVKEVELMSRMERMECPVFLLKNAHDCIIRTHFRKMLN